MPTERIVSPSLNELGSLRTELEPGEKLVLDFFLRNLDRRWEIYIQPHLNGLRPDFVLLNPEVGIAVFEVKNWNLDAMKYWVDASSSKLLANDGHKTFDLRSQNPVSKIKVYEDCIENLFCPRMGKRAAGALITAGIVFTASSSSQTEKLLHPLLVRNKMRLSEKDIEKGKSSDYEKYYPVSGFDALSGGDLKTVFPEALRRRSAIMDPVFASDLRSWLVEPRLSAEQRRPLPFDARQRQLVTSRTGSGYRRIRGPAGSGKSLVLAGRVGELCADDSSFLVVSYNITLLHYIQDLAVRYSGSSRKARKIGVWLNFHEWCKFVCFEAGFTEEYRQLWKDFHKSRKSEDERRGKDDPELDDFLTNTLPEFVGRVIDKSEHEITHYDAILVDEGQDYNLHWWNLLRRVRKPNAEMILVADTTQDIYGTAKSWTEDAMNNSGFLGGPWVELQASYRLPNDYIPYVREYASRFVPDELRTLPELHKLEGELPGAYPVYLRWVNCQGIDHVECCCSELLHLLKRDAAQNIPVADVVFLSSSINMGLSVVERLQENYGYGFHHTFDKDDQVARDLKKAFFLGNAKAKATTIHSFKGYESRAVMVYADSNPNQPMEELLYVALTRLREDTAGSHITVICDIPKFNSYGSTWPNYEKGIRDLPVGVRPRNLF